MNRVIEALFGEPAGDQVTLIRVAGPGVESWERWTAEGASPRAVARMLVRIFERPPREIWSQSLPGREVAIMMVSADAPFLPRVVAILVSGLTPDEINEALKREALG